MANLMDLVRELKTLNARKKAGETLDPDEESRRRELKTYLKTALESQQGGGAEGVETTGVQDPPQSRTAIPSSVLRSAESSAPKPQPSARSGSPAAVTMSGQRAVSPTLDAPQAAEAPRAPPKPFVPKKDAYAIKGVDDLLGAAEQTAGAEAELDQKPKFVADDIPLDEPQPEDDLPPVAAVAPKPYVPKKDAFAIKGSGVEDLMGMAAKSEAVAKSDQFGGRKAKASANELQEAEERAERALKQTKTRERATNADQAAEQLAAIETQYTPPEDDYALEQYYGSYADEGFQFMDAAAVALAPIDSRELELAKATGAISSTSVPQAGGASATVPPGLAFLDDFAALYQKRILPSPEEEVVVDSDDPNLLVPGKRKVTVHMLNGEKKQGAIRALRRGDLGFRLEPSGAGLPEEIAISQCKAVFIHLQSNQQVKAIPGRTLTVTFKDQRTMQGASDDYQPGIPVFSIVPPAGRGQFERIIVNSAAVTAVR